MALITSLEPNNKNRQSIHGPTRCLYCIVDGKGGDRYIQLDTVGSDKREIPDKVSQTIQFDRRAAGQLLQIIRETFPELVGQESHSGVQRDETEVGDEEDAEIEGRTLLRIHFLKERKPALVKRKKLLGLASSGRLVCEVCEFDFAATYGAIGEGFAECHHTVPLAELDGTRPTRLDDLAIVCANCHRMLHRKPQKTVPELRSIVRQNLTAKMLD